MKYFYIILLLTCSQSIYTQTIEDDFEGNGTITTWFGDDCGIDTDFENPYKAGINASAKVLKYTDIGGVYANIRFDASSNFNLTTKNTFSVKIYVSSNGLTGAENNQISLKLQDGNLTEPWSTQSEIIKTIDLNTWQTVTFDFANDNFINLNSSSVAPIYRVDFNRVLLQVNGEDNTSQVIAYIDDFLYEEASGDTRNPVFDTLVWSDEFDGNGAIDATKWHHQTRPIINGQTWANGEIQHYTDREVNSFEENGSLKILAKKETYTNNRVTKNYTSARLNSKFAFTYGSVKIKAKMPFGAGTFPALWMLGQNITETGGYWAPTHGTTGWPDCGEIDIIEHWGNNQNYVSSALHNRSSFGNTINKGGRAIQNASTEFHIYSIDWTSEKMVFKVDGITHYTYNPENKNKQNWPYNAPQYLLFNVAIQPDIISNFTESAMEVDYVRVYQESTASISEDSIENSMELFPNPVAEGLTIRVPSELLNSEAFIFSASGKKIKEFKLIKTEEVIDVSKLSKGIYFLKILNNEKIFSCKIIKK